MTAFDPNEHPRNNQGEFTDKGKGGKPATGAATMPYDEGEEDTGRIANLLSDYVQLKDERKGKVPALKPGDDAIRAQGKLASYLQNNFDGDPDQAARNALRSLYPGEPVPIDESDWGEADLRERLEERGWLSKEDADNAIARTIERRRNDIKEQTRYIEDNSPGSLTLAYWQDGRAVIVNMGKRSSRVMKPDIIYTDCGMEGRVLNFGELQAANAVMGRMDIPDGTREQIANTLMDNSRRSISFIALDHPEQLKGMKFHSSWDVGIAEKRLERQGADIQALRSRYPVDAHGRRSREDEAGYAADLARECKRMGIPDKDIPSGIRHTELCQRLSRLPENGYHDAITGLLRDETNSELNKTYARRAASASSATVYEDKRNRDPEHDRAGRESSFARDFGRIEVDDSVDLDKFRRLGGEYERYKRLLPRERVKADLRFRYTGRHRAIGMYHPAARNIAVDPRHPSSFTHEYFHHLDFTSDPKGRQISMSPDFQRIVQHYQGTVDRDAMKGSNPERWLAPTEILARAGELWMNERAGGSSFLDEGRAYGERWDYKPLMDMHDDVMRFMDRHFG